jgi:hypothetical protein
MLGWLRRWLEADPGRRSGGDCLDCLVRDVDVGLRRATFRVTGARGGCLEGVELESGRNESWRLIRAHQAVEPERFWELWRRFNPGSTLTWEDGDEFDG